ncbi:MAG: hypothetical protein AAFY71_18970 [Bacteroidota bacterium]
MKKLILLIFSVSFCLPSWSQITDLSDKANSSLTCVYEAVGLRNAPGRKAKYLQKINFGEQVQGLGETSYVPSEKKTYVKVNLADGKVGWIHEYLFLEDGFLGVVLEKARIYERAGTPTTITFDSFEAGDIVVQKSIKNGWIFLTTKNRKKFGWVKKENLISNRIGDIEAASLWEKAQKLPEKERAARIAQIISKAEQNGSAVARIMQGKPALPTPEETLEEATKRKSPTITRSTPAKPLPDSEKSSRKMELDVWDRASGKYITEIIETGPATAIKQGIKHPDPYYAFHPSLPPGSRVRMDIPGTKGFVELTIIDKLEEDNDAIIALSPACLMSLFGTINPGDIVISYTKSE